ncbi:hypothetical protein G5I_05345 [Acromyrmex echinatior]|uniref:Uncharacterized protein n=1 Tax=Acromyrmex echinatior TaxID=103372 RepID=F4WHZ8_ACREC|nr:hypothetical protein G5I_05345 [Acromyrmex echinatior]
MLARTPPQIISHRRQRNIPLNVRNAGASIHSCLIFGNNNNEMMLTNVKWNVPKIRRRMPRSPSAVRLSPTKRSLHRIRSYVSYVRHAASQHRNASSLPIMSRESGRIEGYRILLARLTPNRYIGERAKVVTRYFVFLPPSARRLSPVISSFPHQAPTSLRMFRGQPTSNDASSLRVAKVEGLEDIGSLPLLDRLLTDIDRDPFVRIDGMGMMTGRRSSSTTGLCKVATLLDRMHLKSSNTSVNDVELNSFEPKLLRNYTLALSAALDRRG